MDKVKFTGKKLLPQYAKLINDAMYELSGIDGAYKFDTRGDKTELTIYPESSEFGNEPGEMEECLRLYEEIYDYIIAKHPESIVR